MAGAGGVGGYYGARLCERGHDVRFLARGPNLEALRERGLLVRSDFGDVVLPAVRAVGTGAESGPVDAILVCVKAYDNEAAAQAVAGAVARGTSICSLQNGVENEAFFGERFPDATVLGGVARVEAFLESPGVVVQRGRISSITVGAFRPQDRPAARALADALAGGPDPVDLADDVRSALWFKLLIIAGIGGVTAYARCSIGELRADPDLRALMVDVFREVDAVAGALRIPLPPDPVDMMVNSVDHLLDPSFKSSMCRDVERGRPLEVGSLNGAVVRFGDRVGVPTPANRRILDALLPLHREALARRGSGP